MDRTPELLYPVSDQIQFELPMAQRCDLFVSLNMTSPHCRTQSRCQFAQPERLGYVIVSTGIQRHLLDMYAVHC